MEDNGKEKEEIFNINNDQLSTPSMRQLNKKIDLKKIIIGVTGLLALIIIIIIIILAISGGKNDDPENESQNDELRKIGQINCIYDIEYNTQKTTLLSEYFNHNQDISIYVDGTKIKLSKEYLFNKTGIHQVKILIFAPLNMDYMFKNVTQVLSVEMYSNKTAKITSMIGAFEDAKNLINYRVEGLILVQSQV